MTQTRIRWLILALVASVLLLLLFLPQGRFWLFAPLLLLGPGYLLERAWGLPLPPLARPAIWVGASLAITPLVYLWATTAGLRITPLLINLAMLGVAAAIGWRWWHTPRLPTLKDLGLPLGLLLIFGLLILLTIWTRVKHIENLVFPPWVDSVHHATIIRVVAETGQVPYSLRPYLPVDNFGYHWGYHAIAATVLHGSGLSLPTTMLWLGQMLGVLQVVTLASCAATLWQRPLAGIVAGIIVAFLSIMPAYFVSWGRYTLLTGLVMLPAVLVLAHDSVERNSRRSLGLLALIVAGLLPTHFVAAGFGLLWCAAVWLSRGAWRESRWRTWSGLALAVVFAIVLVAPWLAVLIGKTAENFGPMRVQGGDYNSYQNAAGLYWTSNNRMLVALALLGALLTIWRRWRLALTVVLWALLVIMFANPVWIGLPYLSFFNNNIVALAIFIPIALLIGGGVAALDDAISRRLAERSAPKMRGWRAIRTAGLAILTLWWGLQMEWVINLDTVQAQAYDEPALRWAADNTPADARFAVNTVGWLYNIGRGSDGGWWLLPYAGRQVSTPPVIYTYGQRDYALGVQKVTTWLRDAKDQTPADLARWMAENGFSYAYATKNGSLFNSQQLAPSPLFNEVYHSEEVSIFALK